MLKIEVRCFDGGIELFSQEPASHNERMAAIVHEFKVVIESMLHAYRKHLLCLKRRAKQERACIVRLALWLPFVTSFLLARFAF